MVTAGRRWSAIASTVAAEEESAALRASKTAGFERRADDWILQYNLAAHELMQNGRQILTSLIAEQVALHEYQSTKQQITNSQNVQDFLDAINSPDKAKFTNEQLYLWMQGETSRLFYENYRFAFDTPAGPSGRCGKSSCVRNWIVRISSASIIGMAGARACFLAKRSIFVSQADGTCLLR